MCEHNTRSTDSVFLDQYYLDTTTETLHKHLIKVYFFFFFNSLKPVLNILKHLVPVVIIEIFVGAFNFVSVLKLIVISIMCVS